MNAPAKFLFDLDLAADAGHGDTRATQAEIAASIAEAEARGYRNGFAAAQAEIANDNQRRLALALGNIAQSLATTAQSIRGVEMKLEGEAVEVALSVARKLAAECIRREPLTELRALVSDCFRELIAAPHLVIRVNDELYDSSRSVIEDLAYKNGFEGKLIVLADPDIMSGDCRIEWADGGITRDSAAIETYISEVVGRYLSARTTEGL